MAHLAFFALMPLPLSPQIAPGRYDEHAGEAPLPSGYGTVSLIPTSGKARRGSTMIRVMATAEDQKRCPDCAELVLAAARKCRYCGYRFDNSSPLSGGSLLDLLRRPRGTASLRELLARWGTELRPQEAVSYFGHCCLDGNAGYLLITTDRLAFFAGRGQDRVIDWPRTAVQATQRRHRLLGTELAIEGPGGLTATLSAFASRQTPDELLAALEQTD